MGGSEDVAALLRSMVERSGLSDLRIVVRAGVGGYEFRRWCRGEAIPSTFEPLERVGFACGATEWDLDDLCRQWRKQAPYPEVTHAGVRFRGGSKAHVSAVYPGKDLCSRALADAWAALGNLEQVDRLGDKRTRWALDDLLLDALGSDGRLRARARRLLLTGRDAGIYREWTGDPGRVGGPGDLLPLQDTMRSSTGRQFLLGLWLLHPDGAMAACAAELIRRDRSAGDGRARDNRPQALAARRAVEELAGEWVTQWVEWGGATGPPDRRLVEDGIRRCYRLSGVRWPGRVVWVESPFTGALTRRLLGRVLDGDPPRPSAGWRPVDDLRTRMDLELEQLAGGELFGQAETLVAQPVAARLALASFFGQLGSWPRPLIEPTDPDRVRLALARMGEQLPRQARARLGRLLAAADVLEPWPEGREYSHMAGHVQAPWLAKATLLRQVCGRRAQRWLWLRLEAYRDANAAGPWWPSGDVVVVAERPRVVHSEPVALADVSGRRLHAEDGPAVVWNDATALFAVHGIGVPRDLLQSGWSAGQILRARNTEVRRVAIERLGWDRFVAEAKLGLVHGPVPDPGNPGNTLSLYELPAVYGVGARLLLCANASPDRDGTVRHFGLHVPAVIDDAVAAAAWTFDLDPQAYAGLDRAT